MWLCNIIILWENTIVYLRIRFIFFTIRILEFQSYGYTPYLHNIPTCVLHEKIVYQLSNIEGLVLFKHRWPYYIEPLG